MALLVDIFGFASVILRGLVLCAQAFTIGGVAFLLLVARPLAPALGPVAADIAVRSRRVLVWSALALVLMELTTLLVQVAVLSGTLAISVFDAAQTLFAASTLAIAGAGALIAVVARRGRPIGWLVPAVAAILVAQLVCSHAVARMDGRLLLGLAGLVHMGAASVWIGGLPYLCLALARAEQPRARSAIGERYSAISMVSVLLLLAAGAAMAVVYIGSPEALYGTGYGVMVSTKVLLFCGLLLLGGMNFLAVRRLRSEPAAPLLRLRRFAEAELGIGVAVLFAAASLTSQPPGADLTADRASWGAVVERMTPHWPRLTSPEHDALGISLLDAQIRKAEVDHRPAPVAFVPGQGQPPPRNAMDIAWSEFNHHWAGVAVLLIGLLALLERIQSAQWARYWPLALAIFAIPLAVRSDPEVWPLGGLGVLESLRDPEVVQHRLLEGLTATLGLVEWRARADQTSPARNALLFPLLCALGGVLLVTHSHALANLRDQLLIEITHLPLVLAVVALGAARWIEVRMSGRPSRVAGWIWPLAFMATGATLLLYREQ